MRPLPSSLQQLRLIPCGLAIEPAASNASAGSMRQRGVSFADTGRRPVRLHGVSANYSNSVAGRRDAPICKRLKRAGTSMKRKLDFAFASGVARNIRYVPRIIGSLKNWPTYLLHYIGLRDGGQKFRFRNGVVLQDEEGTLSGTIAVVFIRRHYGSIKGKSIIVEIGANVGTFTVYAAVHSDMAKIYCYEPVASNYAALLQNIELNGLQDRVYTFNCAVAAEAGDRLLYIETSPEHSFTQVTTKSVSVPVRCVSLEDILDDNHLQKVDVLKINAEGAEYEILYSTSGSCYEKIDEIWMEYHEDPTPGHDRATLQSFLEARGYVTTYLDHYTPHEGFLWMAKRG